MRCSRPLAFLVVALATGSLIIAPARVRAEDAPGGSSKKGAPAKPPFKPEELDQLVASIALHPDSLLSQILMASTYPLQVVEAARWIKANSKLKGKELTAALEKRDWDPSVKSLVNFPQVLAMLDEKLDWTQRLGDAVLAQQKDVMAAVQRLRAKARETGNLKDSPEQKVTVEPATQTIIIEPAKTEVVYVPTYNPTVVYGTWPYPAYPPSYYYPPGYVAGAAALSFTVGVAMGAAWGYAWGGCNWGGGKIDIDIDKNVNINQDINRDKYKSAQQSAKGARDGKGTWQHDPKSRKGVSYRDQATAQKFQGQTKLDTKSREQFSGFAEKGRQDLARGSSGRQPGTQPSASTRGASQGSSNRGKSGAFDGYGKGSEVSKQSSRGQASRSSSPSRQSSAPASRSSGGSRGGGGGRRR